MMLTSNPGYPKSIGCHFAMRPRALGRTATLPRPIGSPRHRVCGLRSCATRKLRTRGQNLKRVASIAAKLCSDPECWVGPPNHISASSRRPATRPLRGSPGVDTTQQGCPSQLTEEFNRTRQRSEGRVGIIRNKSGQSRRIRACGLGPMTVALRFARPPVAMSWLDCWPGGQT